MNFLEIKSKLKNKTLGIAGCGGLGSNAAVAGLIGFSLFGFSTSVQNAELKRPTSYKIIL